MAVDSVNNNRTAVVAGSLAVGAAAGAGLGYANTKILEGNAPKDSFIKTLDQSRVNHEKKIRLDAYESMKKLSETGNVEDIKNAEVKEVVLKALDREQGIKDISKSSKEEIKEAAKKCFEEVTDADLKKSIKLIEDGSISSLEKTAKAFDKIELPKKGADLKDYQKILKDNYKLFGIEVKDGKVDEAVAAYTKEKFNNNISKIKKMIVDKKAGSKNRLAKAQENIRTVFESAYDIAGKKLKELPKNASEETKAGYKTIKNAIRNFKLSAAAKWGAIAGAALGLTSFVTAKITGKAADKAIAEAQENCECEDCQEAEEE